ncbi:hypothetical protein LTR05_003315 [Lithohypha guttulata]|uniref:Uncharacterized protein n=1 Tax=Lithohypha guttulata TaxID=1690604 RepID=A0AAN7T437_9EURO|nr:hypothetical protein LTR05_003315 [Lithohypha guttulata]
MQLNIYGAQCSIHIYNYGENQQAHGQEPKAISNPSQKVAVEQPQLTEMAANLSSQPQTPRTVSLTVPSSVSAPSLPAVGENATATLRSPSPLTLDASPSPISLPSMEPSSTPLPPTFKVPDTLLPLKKATFPPPPRYIPAIPTEKNGRMIYRPTRPPTVPENNSGFVASLLKDNKRLRDERDDLEDELEEPRKKFEDLEDKCTDLKAKLKREQDKFDKLEKQQFRTEKIQNPPMELEEDLEKERNKAADLGERISKLQQLLRQTFAKLEEKVCPDRRRPSSTISSSEPAAEKEDRADQPGCKRTFHGASFHSSSVSCASGAAYESSVMDVIDEYHSGSDTDDEELEAVKSPRLVVEVAVGVAGDLEDVCF